jgi:hypothetical protein
MKDAADRSYNRLIRIASRERKEKTMSAQIMNYIY